MGGKKKLTSFFTTLFKLHSKLDRDSSSKMFKSPNRNKLECSPFQINSAIHESTLDFLLALYNYSNNTQICCYVMSLCKKKLLHTDFSKHLYLFDLKLQSTYFMSAFSRVMLNLDTCKSIQP